MNARTVHAAYHVAHVAKSGGVVLPLALGGLAMTAVLGDRSTFAPAGLTALAVATGVVCLFAAVLLVPSRLTAAAPPGARDR